MSDVYNVNGFSAYAGFHGGSVASVVTKAEMAFANSMSSGRSNIPSLSRPFVPANFPESTQINRNSNQLKILNNLEEQFNNIQNSRDVAGQTLGSVRNRGKQNNQTINEINAYRKQLEAENDSLLKKGSSKINQQKNDKENASIADQIARARGNFNASSVSQVEIAAFKATASKPASVKKAVFKNNNKKKPAKPKGRK